MPTLPTVSVQVSFRPRSYTDAYLRVTDGRVTSRGDFDRYNAFWIEWTTKEKRLQVVGAEPLDETIEFRGFEAIAGGGASALVVVPEGWDGDIAYRLCVSFNGTRRLAHGGDPTDGGATRECKDVGIQDPQPPPKVIVPGSVHGSRDDGADDDDGVGPASGRVTVHIKRRRWRGSHGEKVPYLLAEVARRPRGTRTMDVDFKLPTGYELHSVEPVRGGLMAPPGTGPHSRNERRVRFEGSQTFAYNVAVTETATGTTCYAYGERAVSRPECTAPNAAKDEGPPKPPPVIIGDP